MFVFGEKTGKMLRKTIGHVEKVYRRKHAFLINHESRYFPKILKFNVEENCLSI